MDRAINLILAILISWKLKPVKKFARLTSLVSFNVGCTFFCSFLVSNAWNRFSRVGKTLSQAEGRILGISKKIKTNLEGIVFSYWGQFGDLWFLLVWVRPLNTFWYDRMDDQFLNISQRAQLWLFSWCWGVQPWTGCFSTLR